MKFYGSETNLNFSKANRITTVRTTIKYKTLAILKMMVGRGFKEGMSMTFSNLEKLLPNLSEGKIASTTALPEWG